MSAPGSRGSTGSCRVSWEWALYGIAFFGIHSRPVPSIPWRTLTFCSRILKKARVDPTRYTTSDQRLNMAPTFVPVSTHASVAQIIPSGSPLGPQLSQEQREFFNRNGFLHFPSFLDRHAVDSILKAIEEVQERWFAQGVTMVNGIPIKMGNDVDGRDR